MTSSRLCVLLIVACCQVAVATAAGLPCHDSEYRAAEAYLYSGKFKAEDTQYIRFFTTFAIPEKWENRSLKEGEAKEVPLRDWSVNALSFVLNHNESVNGYGNITRPNPMPGSDTLWWVDIREYGWSIEDIDAVFELQAYFLSPAVDGDNPRIMFRADWFIVYASDNTKLKDQGFDQFPYYLLQYGKGKDPKNAADFQKAWLVDIALIRDKKRETGTVVDAGDSGVSRHTRQLRFSRTPDGFYGETRDVKSHNIDLAKVKVRDYIEDIFANQADAGEYIATKRNGLQTYLLSAGNNDNFKRVEDGDLAIVVHKQDREDPRVRTSTGCIDCHVFGYIPYTNAIRDIFQRGGKINTKYDDLAREIKAFYLRSKGEEVEENNRIFAAAIKKCNDLAPEDNVRQYRAIYDWYNAKVTSEQAALEVGLLPEDYRKELKVIVTGRLAQLYQKKSVPREVWDSINSGAYLQSALLIKRIDNPLRKVEKQGPKRVPVNGFPASLIVLEERAPLVDKDGKELAYFGLGLVVDVVKDHDVNFWKVKSKDGKWEGFLQKKYAKEASDKP